MLVVAVWSASVWIIYRAIDPTGRCSQDHCGSVLVCRGMQFLLVKAVVRYSRSAGSHCCVSLDTSSRGKA
eukprot:5839229-Amphidinium_carterae.1